MIVEQINARWWFKLNGLIRYAMARNIPGFGPPKIVLTEHPKSGGNWVSQMLAEYLEIPNPRNRLPPRCRCIVHGHFLHVAEANKTIVMWRDGRDVIVSHYYYHLFHRRTIMPGWAEAQQKRLGIKDARDVQRYLPRFIEYCFTDGPPRHMSWKSFAETWKSRTGYVETSYEAMQQNPGHELKKILDYLQVHYIDDAKLNSCISKFSFENVTGRKSGEEDAYSFVRKGIVGDWKNKFTRESREVFDQYAGQTLIDLGYEADRSWVEG